MNGAHTNALRPQTMRGFTLIEVLVSLIIIAVGMLGIAKLQGLALSNTGVASMRSLAAIQAASLASAMHANRSFWAASTAPSFINDNSAGANTFTLQNYALALGTAGSCQNTSCTSDKIAGYDVFTWITSMNNSLPGAVETVTCTSAPPAPESCQIIVSWTENMIAANQQEAAVATANATSGVNKTQAITYPTYELYVVP